jgi:hypothetical protein
VVFQLSFETLLCKKVFGKGKLIKKKSLIGRDKWVFDDTHRSLNFQKIVLEFERSGVSSPKTQLALPSKPPFFVLPQVASKSRQQNKKRGGPKKTFVVSKNFLSFRR